MRKRLAIIALSIAVALVLVVGLVFAGRIGWDRLHRTDFEKAMGMVPSAAKRISYTDWSAVRRELGVRAGDDPGPGVVQKLMDKAYDDDLSSASSIDDSAVALQDKYGFSPATADWEAFAQSKAGASMVLQMPDDTDMDQIRDNLRSLGYQAPKKDDGVWRGGVDLVASIDPTIGPELQYVVVLKDQHAIVASDTSTYAATAAKPAQGDGKAAASVDSVSQMAGRVGKPAAAIVWTRDFACDDLAMASADPQSQDQAKQLIAAAGDVSPLSGLVLAMAPDRKLSVAEQFESSDQAADNVRARARLAVGEAVGRGGSFSDDFKLTSSKAVDSTVLLTLRPRDKTGYVLSALYDGPLIFATC